MRSTVLATLAVGFGLLGSPSANASCSITNAKPQRAMPKDYDDQEFSFVAAGCEDLEITIRGAKLRLSPAHASPDPRPQRLIVAVTEQQWNHIVNQSDGVSFVWTIRGVGLSDNVIQSLSTTTRFE